MKSYESKYIPAFFQILLNFPISEDVEKVELTNEEYATLVHEYVHFLQDITTSSGLSRIVFLHKSLQAYLHEAAMSSGEIPYIINLDHIPNYAKETELESYYNGYDTHKKIHHVDKILCEQYEFNDELGVDETQFVVNIYHNGKENPYVFGRDCIIESMAYLCEKTYGAKIRTNEFPYNSCEILCDFLYPDVLNYPAVLVAMCELSLMHYNSGLEFYEILMDMKNRNKVYSSIDEFEKDYVHRCIFLWGNYCEKLCETLETINYLYPKDNIIFGECNVLINSVLKIARSMRFGSEHMRDVLFISRIMESPELISEYMTKFNSVLFIDENKDIKGMSGFSNILIPYAVLKIFAEYDKKCALHDYCLKNSSKFVDSACLKEPWTKCNGNQEMCPFAAFWYMFSLEGKTVAGQK